jgi:hypothetical protein
MGVILIVSCSCGGTTYRLSVSSAVSNLREMRVAENQVKEKTGHYVDIGKLVKEGLVFNRPFNPTEFGYTYDIVVSESGYTVTAVPENGKNIDQLPFFFLDQTGTIRSNSFHIATVKDEPIGNQ